jgi:nucleoside-diphosphate-sugar epimerase
MTGRAVIFGRGQIGQACATVLAATGWDVATFDRATLIGGGPFDRHDPKALAAALGDGADLVIDTIGFDRADADLLVPLGSGIGQLITISSASVYADAAGRSLDEARVGGFPEFDGPITESQATVAPGDATYSTRKVAMEQRLLDAMPCPVAVLRPSAIHGIGSRHPREWWFVKRLLDGRRVVPLAYEGESRFHTTAAASIGNLAALLASRRGSGIFNIADPDAPTVAEIGGTIAARMARPLTIQRLAGPPRGHVGQTPWAVPRPYLVDSSAALAAGYSHQGDYAAHVAPMIDWLITTANDGDWRARFPGLTIYGFDMFDYAAEDAA